MLIVLLSFMFIQMGHAVIEAPYLQSSSEQNPSSIEWKHIVTEHFDIIFPQEIEIQAQRAAHLLEKAYPFVTRSLEVKPRRIPLVLQNQSVISNGFVSLAPRRTEWNVTPATDPELTNTEWLKTLAIHEFRHVVQFQKTRQGFNRYLEILFGEIGQALGLGLTLPPWFLEGDAVGMETALTIGGRGRLPLFERDLKALLLSGKDFNYDKAHLGSYRDYIPSHYVYGYFYTSLMRSRYQDLFLSRLADESAERSYNPLTFYNSFHSLTHVKFEDFYADVLKDLISEWKVQDSKLTPTLYQVKNLGKRFGWTNYYYPQKTEEGDVLALKRGLSFIDQFVILKGKKEKSIFYPGPLAQEYPYKLRSSRIAFLELELDPRWGYRDYTRLKVYDLIEKKIVLDVPHKKWRLAVLDPTAKHIALVQWDKNQNQTVITLDSKGTVENEIAFPSSEVITSLDWLSEDEVVMVVKDQDDLKSLVKLTLSTKEIIQLTEKSVTNLGFVTVHEDKILFESPASGIDNIWLYTPEGNRQLTSSKFGAYAPAVMNDKLLYNDYSVEGMDVVQKDLDLESEQPSENSFTAFYEKFAQNENSELLKTDLLTSQNYEVKKYSLTKNAFNFHSWVLLAPPLSSTFTVMGLSRDILNNLTLTAGALYDLNEKTSQGFVSASWSHYYPLIDLRAGFGSRRQRLGLTSGQTLEDKWEEGTLEAGIGVPWKFIQGRFLHAFTTRVFSKLIKVNNKIPIDPTEVSDGALFSPGAEILYEVNSRMSRRDLLPAWGFSMSLHHEKGTDITGDNMRGRISSADSRYYVPGFMKHHSFWQQLAYENQNDQSYQYSSVVLYPRGTTSLFLTEFSKYSANYTFPLAYPDYNLSRYVYFKRINFNLFYDDLNGRFKSQSYHAATTGWEMVFETNFVRIFVPLNIGIRGNYIIDGLQKKENYEIFLSSIVDTF